ncbi:MAG: hypothetical protein H5T69_04730 [Chloroflexi bacterium]|nr:hypothetical protein [Chloroflexota bacterium]
MSPTPDATLLGLNDTLAWLPWIASVALALLWLRGLRRARRRMKAATQPQTATAKTSHTPLQVVLSSLAGCLTYMALLLIPALLALALGWYLLTR